MGKLRFEGFILPLGVLPDKRRLLLLEIDGDVVYFRYTASQRPFFFAKVSEINNIEWQERMLLTQAWFHPLILEKIKSVCEGQM